MHDRAPENLRRCTFKCAAQLAILEQENFASHCSAFGIVFFDQPDVLLGLPLVLSERHVGHMVRRAELSLLPSHAPRKVFDGVGFFLQLQSRSLVLAGPNGWLGWDRAVVRPD